MTAIKSKRNVSTLTFPLVIMSGNSHTDHKERGVGQHLSVAIICVHCMSQYPVPLLLTSLTQRPACQFLSVQEEAYGKLIPSASLVLL